MLLALLLVGRAAAAWVEISQQHYRKPVRTITALDTTRHNYPNLHQNPTKTTYQDIQHPARNEDQTRNTHLDQGAIQTSMRDSHLQNMQNPVRKYKDDLFSATNGYPHHEDMSFQKPIREHFFNHSGPFPRPVRFDPFLQEDIMTAQSPVRNTNVDKVSNPNRDMHSNKKIKPTMEDTYLNRSITELNWDQNVYKENGKFATTVSNFDSWNDNTQKPNERNYKPDEKIKLKEGNRIQDETVSGKIERVPNIGSVKRVQLANTPVKSPALNNKNTNRINSQHNYGTHNHDSFSDELDLETSIFNSDEGSVSQKLSNKFKQETSETEQIDHVDSENPKSPLLSFQRNPFTHNPNDVTEVTKVILGNEKITQNGGVSKYAESAEHKNVNKSNTVTNGSVQLSGAILESLEEFTANEDVLPKAIDKNKKNIKPKEVEPNMVTGESRKNHRESVKIDKIDQAGEESSSEKKENINKSSNEIKVNTIENILKFLKVVADTISKNTRRGKNKITYLNELKHTLMANIKNRIDATWPDDETSAGTRRHSRSATARGHVELPSSESALMTISFLTFAVFLIKLVLQVIQTYKHKAMVMAPLMLATAGRAVSKRLREN